MHAAHKLRTFSLGCLKATALAAELAEQHHGFVWDHETDELFTVAEWKKRRTESVRRPARVRCAD